MTQPNILVVQSSARIEGSATRTLSDQLAAQFGGEIVTRDLLDGEPLIDPAWITANFTDPATRTDDQRDVLSVSDALVAELGAADIVVIGAPIYNFSVPASLKAWIDQIARVGETFAYSEAGPKGLLQGKRAYIVVASGGTAMNSDIDFMTPYLRHALGFVGITDVTVIDASAAMMRGEAARQSAEQQITAIGAAVAA